jgi:hypothetical protein
MSIKYLSREDYKKLMEPNDHCNINQIHIALSFIDFEPDPEHISFKLGLKPISTARKGEEYSFSPKKISEYNHWEFEKKTKTNDFIGDVINDFISTIIKPRINSIKEISSIVKTTRLSIIQYYYTGNNPGLTLDKIHIKLLSDIEAEIDMDIYCLYEG